MSVQTIGQLIPLESITIVENVRTKTGLDPASLKELAESIKTEGVLQPIIVARTESGFAVIAGQRRTLAAKLAGLTEIPAIVNDGQDGERLKAKQIIENLHRTDLSLSETCGAVRDMLAMVGKPAEVAKRLAKSRAWVSKHLSPTGPGFNQTVRDLIGDGKLNDIETALMMNQIAKQKAGGPVFDKLAALGGMERLSRAQVRAELERLKTPDDDGEDDEGDGEEETEEGGESEAPTGKQQIIVEMNVEQAAQFEALGGATWLRKTLRDIKRAEEWVARQKAQEAAFTEKQNELPV